MANENKEIGEIVKKCKILLLDIEGTTTSISFVKDKLFPYAEENAKQFLDSKWESEEVKEVVTSLRKLALEDQEKSVDGVVSIPGEDATKEDQIEGLVKNVKWQMSADRKAGPLKLLQGLIWKQGYDSGDIKGHVYDDVSPALKQWRSNEGQKVYIYSSGSVDAQKLLFGQSLAGNLLPLIDGHFDTAVGAKQEAASYAKIVEKVDCKADEILFLTDIVKEAEAARESGLHVALVSREGNAPLPASASDAFPVIHSLQQLVSNKRKPESQEEQPAKVPKTEVEADVKSVVETKSDSEAKVETSEPEAKKKETKEEVKQEEIIEEANKGETKEEEKKEIKEIAKKEEAKKEKTKKEDLEKMDVEEIPAPVPEDSKEEKMEVQLVETTIVEVTDAKEIENVPVAEVEPVVIEDNVEKTEIKETEKMDTEPIEADASKPKEAVLAETKNGDVSAPVAEETPSTVITEIEEISEKHDVADVVEIIDDIEPVVEEPVVVEDMEDLQNVGEVLEKECDEILSKVQDVTNLDNIPLKPLLNTIAEETMETENGDTSDIVEGILDSELELELKQRENIDLNTVTEISDPKSDEAEDKTEPQKTSSVTKEVPVEEKAKEVIKPTTVTDGNVVSNAKEKKAESETKTEEIKKVEEIKKADDIKKIEEIKKVEEIEKVAVVEAESKQNTGLESKDAPAEQKETPPTEEKPPKESEKPAPDTPAPEKLAPEKSAAEKPITEEKKEVEAVPEDTKPVEEPKVNGKATNGDSEKVNLNGDASKEEELSSRLSVEENSKAVVNGSNGNSNGAEQGQGDSKDETEVTDIKVKTVAVDETRTDPIEQPTEA